MGDIDGADADLIAMGDGIAGDGRWTVELDDLPFAATVTTVFDESFGRYVIDEVVARRKSRSEVTGAALRLIGLQEFVQTHGLKHVWVPRRRGTGLVRADEWLNTLQSIKGRVTDDDASLAAIVYKVASIVNLPPLKAIADTLDVSQSTATRLAARARDLELLPNARRVEIWQGKDGRWRFRVMQGSRLVIESAKVFSSRAEAVEGVKWHLQDDPSGLTVTSN